MRILVTGAAGFIGYHTAKVPMARGCDGIGPDNHNFHNDVRLKEARLAQLEGDPDSNIAGTRLPRLIGRRPRRRA
jgi:UDP-glucuronate 4-epimerase